MIKLYGAGDRCPKDCINVTSSSKTWSRQLSPFLIGPCNVYGKYKSKNIENLWQFSKVYHEHINKFGFPKLSYFKWAEKGWKDSYAHRYPMGKGKLPQYSYWDGEILDYVTARILIYIPMYSKSVCAVEAFYKLKDIYDKEGQISMWDYDTRYPEGFKNKDILFDPKYKVGHGLVLKMLLEWGLDKLLKACKDYKKNSYKIDIDKQDYCVNNEDDLELMLRLKKIGFIFKKISHDYKQVVHTPKLALKGFNSIKKLNLNMPFIHRDKRIEFIEDYTDFFSRLYNIKN